LGKGGQILDRQKGSRAAPANARPISNNNLSDGTELREAFRKKLQLVTDEIGSVTAVAAMIGVNRTQFSRYLAGVSMPRPDLLFRLCRKLDLPMEWFFDRSPDNEASLAEFYFGTVMRRMVRGQRFRVDEIAMPDGFYIIWKGTFAAKDPYEMQLSLATTQHGVKRFKTSANWRRRGNGERVRNVGPPAFRHSVMMRSTNGYALFLANGRENHVFSFFVRETAPLWDGDHRTIYSGLAVSGAFGPGPRSVLVPVFLSHIEPSGMSVLEAARKVGGYGEQDVPADVRTILENCSVPVFQHLY
jgi:transcriptional regulator with XRE-family HTH domain